MNRFGTVHGIGLKTLVCASIASTGTGCIESKPNIQAVNARVTGIDWQGVNLAFDVAVDNPLPIPLGAPLGQFAVDIADTALIRSDNIPPITVGARETNTITLPARCEYKQLFQIAERWNNLAEIPYRLHGFLAFRVADTHVELPFEHRDELPVLKMPKIEIEEFETTGFTMTGAGLLVEADIENPNAFALGVADLGYVLSIGGVRIADITASTSNRIASRSKGKLELRGHVSAAQAIGGILSKRDINAVKLELVGTLDTPFGDIGVLPAESP